MIALVVATARECAAVLPGVPAPEPGAFGVRTVNGCEAVVLVTGVGPLNAALGLGRLMGERTVDGVLNLGVGGSFDVRTLPLGAVVAADEEIWPEYGLRTAGGVDPRGISFPLFQGPGGPVYDRVALAPARAARGMGLELPAQWPTAPMCTVSAASGDEATARAVAMRMNAPGVENMEGFALALGCARAQLPFLEVRAVSNVVGARGREDWDLDGALEALGRAARTLLGDAP